MVAQLPASEAVAGPFSLCNRVGFVSVVFGHRRLHSLASKACLRNDQQRKGLGEKRGRFFGLMPRRTATVSRPLCCALAEGAANACPATSKRACRAPDAVCGEGQVTQEGESTAPTGRAANAEQCGETHDLDDSKPVLSAETCELPKRSVVASGHRRRRTRLLQTKVSGVAVLETPLQTPLEETVVSADPRLPVPNWQDDRQVRLALDTGEELAAEMSRNSTGKVARTDRATRRVDTARAKTRTVNAEVMVDSAPDWDVESDRNESMRLRGTESAFMDQYEDELDVPVDDEPPLAVHADHYRKKCEESSTLRWYLHMIGRVDMLSPQEEISLSRQISQLLHWERKRMEMHNQLDRSPSDEELAKRLGIEPNVFIRSLAEARRAKDRMVAANLRLVVSIAKRYLRRGLPLEDLIQEGSLGLIRAAEKFDSRRGCRFSTYATWWVKQSVMRALADQGRTVRLPVHLHDRLLALRKVARDLSMERGREPTEREICDRLGISRKRLRELRSLAVQTISLESAVQFGGGPSGPGRERTTLADTIVHESASPEEQIEFDMLRESLERSLQLLSHVEKRIVRLRYGLDSGVAKTLDEVGALVRLPREEVRAIEHAAFRKLRHTGSLAGLKDYITSPNTSAL